VSSVLERSAGSEGLSDAACSPPFDTNSSINGLAEVWPNIARAPTQAGYATNAAR